MDMFTLRHNETYIFIFRGVVSRPDERQISMLRDIIGRRLPNFRIERMEHRVATSEFVMIVRFNNPRHLLNLQSATAVRMIGSFLRQAGIRFDAGDVRLWVGVGVIEAVGSAVGGALRNIGETIGGAVGGVVGGVARPLITPLVVIAISVVMIVIIYIILKKEQVV